jgi:hypothetical protein
MLVKIKVGEKEENQRRRFRKDKARRVWTLDKVMKNVLEESRCAYATS